MLSEEVIDKVVDRLVSRIEEANTFVLGQIAESVKKVGTLSPSQIEKIGQMVEFGGDFDKIVKELAKITKLNEKEIYEIFEEVAKNDYEFAKQFYEYRNKKYIPYDENIALKKQVQAIARITADAYKNISDTRAIGFGIIDEETKAITFRGLKEQYQKIIDEAIINVSQGKETFDDAMYKRLKELGESGLKVVYKNEETGKTYAKRMDSAVRQNLKEGLTKMHIEMQEQIGKEFDSDGVEISVHSAPAPDHAEVQGRQFSKKEFEKFQSDRKAVDYKGKVFPPEHDGRDRRSIGQYNCYHYPFDIVLGVSTPEYSDEQLQKIIDDNEKGFEFEGKHYTLYEGTQVQRRIETEIRKAKDNQIMGKKTGNTRLIEYSQDRITKLSRKYKDFSKAGDLPTKLERARVSSYKRVAVKKQK